jgi:phosphoserine phosphatase RsbU/P
MISPSYLQPARQRPFSEVRVYTLSSQMECSVGNRILGWPHCDDSRVAAPDSRSALASARGSLSELVGGLNRQVCANSQNGRFTTAFLAELDPATGDLSYLCAGHNPPILTRENGSVERLKSDNIPLGIEVLEDYKTGVTRLGPADFLVIYTDGVTEARNEKQQEFGEKRLLTLLENAGGQRSALTLSHIMQSLDEFVGAATQHDDITCLVVRRS